MAITKIIKFIAASIPVIYVIAYIASSKPAPPTKHIPPEPDNDYIHPIEWMGVPIDKKDRFLNYVNPFYRSYPQVLRWVPFHAINLFKNRHKKFPVLSHSNKSFLDKKNTLIWLGHASFFFNLNGIKILIDPHFYNVSLYKRHSLAPINVKYFTDIDYILISHDHEDHCNKKSLTQLFVQNPTVTILTGLNMDLLLQSFTSQKLGIKTADWYKKFSIKTDELKIYFTPSRHYCSRLGGKFNGCLWGGFIVKYKDASNKEVTIYFEGDSGKSDHFADIKKLFSPDIAIIGIGAYKPEWFMHPNHMSPKDAIEAFDACGAKMMIPMHYGTFNLSNEDMEMPLQELQKNEGNRNIQTLIPGEIYQIKNNV